MITQKQYLKKNKFYLIYLDKENNKVYVVMDIIKNKSKDLEDFSLKYLDRDFYFNNCLCGKPNRFNNIDINFITLIDLMQLNKNIAKEVLK